jgi:hypothetical protein
MENHNKSNAERTFQNGIGRPLRKEDLHTSQGATWECELLRTFIFDYRHLE